tara:strand:- start:87 stop:467 length:381 start_codon:yes stop_codon:yes gene_type:complete
MIHVYIPKYFTPIAIPQNTPTNTIQCFDPVENHTKNEYTPMNAKNIEAKSTYAYVARVKIPGVRKQIVEAIMESCRLRYLREKEKTAKAVIIPINKWNNFATIPFFRMIPNVNSISIKYGHRDDLE